MGDEINDWTGGGGPSSSGGAGQATQLEIVFRVVILATGPPVSFQSIEDRSLSEMNI